VGKSNEVVTPDTLAAPSGSTVMAVAPSKLLPPKYVEYTICPEAFSFVTKASAQTQPLLKLQPPGASCMALAVGKFNDCVCPAR